MILDWVRQRSVEGRGWSAWKAVEPNGRTRLLLDVCGRQSVAYWYSSDAVMVRQCRLATGEVDEAKRQAQKWAQSVAVEIGLEFFEVPAPKPQLRPIQIHPRTKEVMKEIGMAEWPENIEAQDIDANFETFINDLVQMMRERFDVLQRREQVLDDRESEWQERRQFLAGKDVRLTKREAALKQREAELAEREAKMADRNVAITDEIDAAYLRGKEYAVQQIREGLQGIWFGQQSTQREEEDHEPSQERLRSAYMHGALAGMRGDIDPEDLPEDDLDPTQREEEDHA